MGHRGPEHVANSAWQGQSRKRFRLELSPSRPIRGRRGHPDRDEDKARLGALPARGQGSLLSETLNTTSPSLNVYLTFLAESRIRLQQCKITDLVGKQAVQDLIICRVGCLTSFWLPSAQDDLQFSKPLSGITRVSYRILYSLAYPKPVS